MLTTGFTFMYCCQLGLNSRVSLARSPLGLQEIGPPIFYSLPALVSSVAPTRCLSLFQMLKGWAARSLEQLHESAWVGFTGCSA